ncbi:hypothetical protein [Rheinheimera texasensis]|uniref:hypothetical protein n=1 Tax=Rheinheimera texasensis TaxID=306205 RepID=UPI0032B2BCFA
MRTLTEELSKPEYAALTDEQALSALRAVTVGAENLIPATTVNQLFAKLDLTGFIQDIAATHDHQFRHKMASVILSIGGDHPFNFIGGTAAGDGNLAMLDSMIANLPDLAVKLQQFRAVMYDMANKKRPYSGVTLAEVIAARSATLDGQWHELAATDAPTFVVRLSVGLPEHTSIVIQMQDQYDEGQSEWYHATALHGLLAAREYTAALPHNLYPRKLRWKCDYQLNASVSTR